MTDQPLVPRDWPRCDAFPCAMVANGYDGKHVGHLCYWHAKVALRLAFAAPPAKTAGTGHTGQPIARKLPGGRHVGPRAVELPYIPRDAIGAHR